LAGDNKPETVKFRAFLSRYAHYVLIRTQCFGGMFDEIAGPSTTSPPAPSHDSKKSKSKNKSASKPITSTNLRQENLDAAKLLLNAGVACVLRDGEECENTALAVERVASDLISLTGAVAKALNKALPSVIMDDTNNNKNHDDTDDDKHQWKGGVDVLLLKKWVEFYNDELAPKTRAMVKKTAPKLDAFSLFLPSRPSDTVSQDLIQKGLKLGEEMESGKTKDTNNDKKKKKNDEDDDDDADDDETAAVVVVVAEEVGEEGEEEISTKDAGIAEKVGQKETWKEVSHLKKKEVTKGTGKDAVNKSKNDNDDDDEEEIEEVELDEYEYEEDEEYYDDDDDEEVEV
jgi:hypothetical protein